MYLLLLFIIPLIVYIVIKISSKKTESVTDLPKPVDDVQPTFQVVYAASDSIEANLVMSMLRESDIESFLSDENIVSAHPFLSNAVGGVKVKVYTEDFEKATQALEGYLDPPVTCVFCGSNNTMKYYKSGDGINGDFTSFIETTLVPGRHEQNEVAYHCNNCEREFVL